MICFARVGVDIYPQVRVVYVNNAGNWSNSTLVKEGTTYVDVYQSGGVARWGDYSGISRKLNAGSPQVWLSGGFGSYRLGEHAFDTWIAQVTGVSIGIQEPSNDQKYPITIYPNPVYDKMQVEFSLPQRSLIGIDILDIQGNVVKVLLRDTAPQGKNSFSFNKGALTSGVYFIRIQSETNVISYEKFVVK